MKKYFVFVLMFAVEALAAEFVPPPEAISLEDPRMAEFCANQENRAVLTGRLVGVPDELKGEIEVSCRESLFTGTSIYVTREVEVAADGSFRIEFDLPVPLRRVTLRLTEAGLFKARSYDFLLAKGLNVDCRYVVAKNHVRVTTSGVDKEMNDAVQKFEDYEKEKQAALWKRMRPTLRDTRSLDEMLAEINTAKRELDELLRASAPQNYAWLIQGEINVRYALDVFRAGSASGAILENRPEWDRAMAATPRVLGGDGHMYYSVLEFYLKSTMTHVERRPTPEDMAALAQRRLKRADPELGDIYKELKEARDSGRPLVMEGHEDENNPYQQLTEAGISRPDARLKMELDIRHFKERISAAKLDMILLQQMPVEPEETRAALELFATFVGERWPTLFVARLETKYAGLEAILSKAAAVPLAGFDRPPQTLPLGAKLYFEQKILGADLLKRIQKTFPGKTLMLGFWAPWYESCLPDLQRSDVAYRKVQDMPAVFIYLGCRTDEASWKSGIAALGISGVHVMLTPKQESELRVMFGSACDKGYPSYLIIDKNGAVRPGILKRFFLMKTAALRKMLE